MSVTDKNLTEIGVIVLNEGGGECVPSPGDWRSMDKQAHDARVGIYIPTFGTRPEDEVVKCRGREDEDTSEMVCLWRMWT